MRRLFLLTTLLSIGIGVIYLYKTNSAFKVTFENWLGDNADDSIKIATNSDTLSVENPEKRKPRERIPKKIKPDKYYELDKYAKETPEKYSQDKMTLAKYLVKPAKNELEKTRLLYIWMATHIQYDDEGYNKGIYGNQNADSVLIRRLAVCSGYSELFQELGTLMELEVATIIGYSKGYGFQQGDKFSETDHAWNAVKINGEWKLVDVTWGNGYGVTVDNQLKSVNKFDPYWFCVDPHEFIFTHLPENKEWQLVTPAITLQQFQELPYLTDTFFKLGFNGAEVYKNALAGIVNEFVLTYDIDFPLKGINLPIQKNIMRGSEYLFVLHSEYADQIAIIDGGEWKYFQKEDYNFSIKHTPLNDQLSIVVKINWFDSKFSTIAVYSIKDELI